MKIETEYIQIFHYCLYFLHHKEDAEDVTQETFLHYFQHPEYQKYEKQYLYKIAKNLCIDKLRKISPESLPENLSEKGLEIPERVALKMAMETLPEEDREIILLRYVNGEKISLIAEMFGVSRFVMSRRIRKITQILKGALQ